MGLHRSVSAFTPSDPNQSTEKPGRREPETRIPMIGAHAGAWPEAKPGCTVRALMQLERDVAEAQRLNAKARSIVREKVSAAGVLRKRRVSV